MTRPLATVDPNYQDPHDSNALPTKKRAVTVPSLDHEQYSASSPGTYIVSNMRDTNSSAPLFDSCCLSSPLQTLALTLESSSNGCITIVDVAQAYQTLYNRLRASTSLLIGRNEAEAEQLRSSIPTLVQCLKRDMGEGLKFFSHALPTSSAKLSSTDLSFSGIEDPEIQTSIDSSLLCQAALNVASALLALPALNALLSKDDKTNLLRPIVEMCIEHSLPIFDHKRIQYLAFSCLRSEVACAALTPTQREGLSTTLNRTLDSHDKVDAQLHALKNIQAFISRSPSRFAEPCLPILLKVLALLQTSSGICRVEVVKTLCAFAMAKFQILDALPDTVTGMATSTHEFLGKQKSGKKSVGDEHLLPAILKDAIKGDGAIWSLTTLASLVILGDAHIFSQPRSLKLVFDALRYSSRHKIPGVASLHAEVWKCLVWALSRSFSVQEEVDAEAREDTYQRAFQMLAQEIRPTVGTCLVAVLMQDHPAAENENFRAWNAGEAVKIIKQLVKQTTSQHFLEGYALLQHMVGDKPPDGGFSSIRPSDFVRNAMINGSWLSSSLTDLEEILKVPHPFPLSHIRPFSEVEVQAHWGDLSESWATSVEYFQSSPATEVLDDLTEIWQALILSQAHLTQSQSRLAASSPFAANFASLILRSLSAAAEPDERVRQIGLVRRWWNVLKNVFDPPWLSVPAGIVLTGLLDKKVDLGVDKVEDAWIKLCFELVSTNIPTFLHFLHTRVAAEGKEGPETPSQCDDETRLLWVVYVRHCVQVGSDQSWTDLAALLSLPFRCDAWVLSARESGTWNEGLAVMLLAAKQDSVDELNATQHLIEQLNDDKRDSVTIALFEAIVSDSTKNSICRQIVRSLDDRLSEWYNARNVAVALRAMGVLGRFWRSEEPSELVSSVTLVQKGLSSWLQDSQARMSNVEHAKMVDLVFIPVMECLSSSLPNDANTLTTLETLFMSVFAKPSPLGADSFLSFFRSHVLRLPNLRTLCPERLFTAVKSYADLCNEPLEGDNSILTPSSPSTVTSDSQSPQKQILPHEYSHFGEFQSPVAHGTEAGNSPEIVTTPKPTTAGMPSGPSSSSPVARRGVELPQGIIPPSPNVFLSSPEIPVASVHRVPKRHHTGGYFEIPDSETIESPRPLKRTKTMPLPRPMDHSRNSDDRHLAEVAPTSSPLPPSSDPALESELRSEGEEDDYDSWEAGISRKDIQDLRNELNLEGEVLEDVDSYILHDSSSPSPTRFPFRSRMRERSQTAPEPDPQSPLLDETEPFARGALRRHHTSGSFEHEDNTQLKAVRHAYATVVDSGGVSQMGIEELMQMKRLTSRIGQAVDEHIEQQLEKEGRLTGPSGRERSRTPL